MLLVMLKEALRTCRVSYRVDVGLCGLSRPQGRFMFPPTDNHCHLVSVPQWVGLSIARGVEMENAFGLAIVPPL